MGCRTAAPAEEPPLPVVAVAAAPAEEPPLPVVLPVVAVAPAPTEEPPLPVVLPVVAVEKPGNDDGHNDEGRDDEGPGWPGYRAELVDAPVFGGQVFVMEAGDPAAPPVVLVHGLGESGCRDWDPVLPALAARYHVVAFDLPGFGRSTHANELYSPENYANFIHALLQSRLHRPFNLVGHSMGGALALYYAARFPAEVARLLLIDAAGVLHRKAFVNFAVEAGLDNLFGIFAGSVKALAEAAAEGALRKLGPFRSPGAEKLLDAADPSLILHSEILRRTVLGTPTRIAALAVILENFAPAIDGVRSPTWILWGSNDAIASPRAGRLLQARLPVAQLVVLDGSGHDPMASRPASVEKFLLEALATPAVPVGPKIPTWAPSPSTRKGRCEREKGVRFKGDYGDIEIDGCDDVVLQDVRATSLRIFNSNVRVENTQIIAKGIALEVKGSRVVATASDFSGEVALQVGSSRLDLAGIRMRSQRVSVRVGGPTTLIFSVSSAERALGRRHAIDRRYLHEQFELNRGDEL